MQQNETKEIHPDEGENGDYLFSEINNPDFEETIGSIITELMATHSDDQELVEKAVSTESVSEAKRRGLVPQSGDWEKPKRWVRPEDADVSVEEEKEDKPRKKAGSGVVWPLDDETNKLIENIFGAGVDISDFQNMYSIGLDDFYTEIEFLYGFTKPSYPGVLSPGKLSVSIELHTEDEETYAGVMSRYFTREGGKIIVTHESFSIEEKYQGKGIATDINEHVEEEYERLGVSEIQLHADADIGGYAWARQGYDFSTKNELEEMQDMFSFNIEKGDRVFENEEELIDQVHRFTHSWQFANWNPTNAPHGKHFGKKWMLGTSWHGKKKLDKKSKGYKRGKIYYALKRRENEQTS